MTRPTLSLALLALMILPTWAVAQEVLPRSRATSAAR